MALVNCEECGREVSDRAAACPHCGCPVTPQHPVAPAEPVPAPEAEATPALRKPRLGKGGKIALAIAGGLVVVGAAAGGIIAATTSGDPDGEYPTGLVLVPTTMGQDEYLASLYADSGISSEDYSLQQFRALILETCDVIRNEYGDVDAALSFLWYDRGFIDTHVPAYVLVGARTLCPDVEPYIEEASHNHPTTTP